VHDNIRDRMHNPHTYDEAKELTGDDKPDWLKVGNVWYFTQLNTEYGSDYPGRIPGQIVQNLLIHYTDPYAAGSS
jgi:hypothetical protein